MDEDQYVIVSLDNGISGSAGIIYPDNSAVWFRTPIKKVRNYQKTKKNISRIDVNKLRQLLSKHLEGYSKAYVLLERPYCNPGGFNSSLSAARALEATLIVLEDLGLPYQFVDSKEWQSKLLPGVSGREELKEASFKKGKELFPKLKFKGDADSLLMAKWGKDNNICHQS